MAIAFTRADGGKTGRKQPKKGAGSGLAPVDAVTRDVTRYASVADVEALSAAVADLRFEVRRLGELVARNAVTRDASQSSVTGRDDAVTGDAVTRDGSVTGAAARAKRYRDRRRLREKGATLADGSKV